MASKERLIIEWGRISMLAWEEDRGEEGVCGKYGLGRGNEAGRDLVEWCEEMGMAHVNSFMSDKRRNTWRHPATVRWVLVRGKRDIRRWFGRKMKEIYRIIGPCARDGISNGEDGERK